MSAPTRTIAYHAAWLAAGKGDVLSPRYAHGDRYPRWVMVKKYSWAIPSEDALAAIAEHSPRGVVEIGAGAGYWAMLLRERGVDVIAYDPAPAPDESKWHDGHAWSEVLRADHTAVIGHPDRTLLLCWPNYDEPHTAEAVELFGGDTVIYIGEPASGCTGDARLHALLGEPDCWCWDEPCACGVKSTAPLFREVAEVEIPQWHGLHDSLRVFKRRTSTEDGA